MTRPNVAPAQLAVFGRGGERGVARAAEPALDLLRAEEIQLITAHEDRRDGDRYRGAS